MPRWQEDQDDLDETEDPDEADQDSDEELTDTTACRRCGREIYEDADRCPYCGLSVMPAASSRTSPWLVVGAILALLAVLMWLVL